MKPLKLIHYVEKSFQSKPASVILMSDEKEYISCGCVFVERTEDNISRLIRDYWCEQELDELFNSPAIEFSEVKSFRSMFQGCTSLTSVDIDTRNGVYFGCMFYGCTSLTSVDIDASKGTKFSSMFSGCTSLTSVSIDTRNGVYFSCMFYGCTNLSE